MFCQPFMNFPEMFLARRKLNAPVVEDVPEAITCQLKGLNLKDKIRSGMRIAVTAGSRGIANNVLILATVVSVLKKYGAQPFLIPCMGSHGGATPEGQLEVLRALGITEEFVGCSIISQMDVVKLGHTKEGIPVYIDKVSASADGIVVINRVKPHTDYKGDIESGLMKMMAIGLGKHVGALTAHKHTMQYGYQAVILSIAREILRSAPILFGLAIVENICGETARVVALEPNSFEETEKVLLKEAKKFSASLPFDELDILILDEMGKQIGGTGVDTNVIGRIMFVGSSEPERPRITRVVTLDLTEESLGNAVGVGLVDFVTQKLANKIDYRVTYINCLTARTPERAHLPVVGETDREAIEWAFQTIRAVEPQHARVVKIKNTLHLNELYISKSLVSELRAKPDWEVEQRAYNMHFDLEENVYLD